MKRLKAFLLLHCLAFFLLACNQEPPTLSPPIVADQAIAQTADWTINWWHPRHNKKKQLAKTQKIDLLMLGDSITHHFEDTGLAVWEEYFQPKNAFNLGFSGDRTEHVLWRLQNGAVENMQPKLVVLMIGTNNTGQRMDPAHHTAKGISAIVAELKKQLPETKILLLGVFPREYSPLQDMRIRNENINRLIAKLNDGQHVFYLDIGEVFLNQERLLFSHIMPDFLHPNAYGYKLWAEAIEPSIQKLMQ